jgi:hypothetical protein
MAKIIIEDKRPIKKLFFGDPEETLVAGKYGIEKIVPYHENGEMAPVVWFAVYKNGEILSRFNSAQVEGIEYAEVE